MKRKEFVVFGVGDFGMYVAKTLANSGATVMVVDKDEERLEQIASEVTHTICADATNPEAVKQLGIGNYDGAIIGVGRSLETSALITMQLKELNVPFIMAKASTDMEGRILSRIGADKVIFPDRAMGIRVGNDIMNGNYFEAIELSDEYSIVDMAVPSNWAGNIGAVKYPLALWHQYYRYPRIGRDQCKSTRIVCTAPTGCFNCFGT